MNSSHWKPGQSGNLKGRPPSERSLTKIIERALNKTVLLPGDDKRTARKRIMAEVLAQGVTEGKLSFPDGTELELDGKEWVDYVMRLLNHIEGPAKREIAVEVDMPLLVWDIEEMSD